RVDEAQHHHLQRAEAGQRHRQPRQPAQPATHPRWASLHGRGHTIPMRMSCAQWYFAPMQDAVRDHDRMSRVLLEASGVPGVRVHLDQAWREITSRTEYPQPVARLLGKAAVATSLLTAHAKVEGRLSLQL